MYKQQPQQIRIFSPIILFHDETTCRNDYQVIELKKKKVNAMLKSNGQFWSNVIKTSRSYPSSPPQTPPPTSFVSSHQQQKWYGTPPSSSSSSEEEEEEEEEEPKQKKRKMIKSSNGRKRRGNLPKSVTAILKQWLINHCKHPYPTEEEKKSLELETNLTLNQISNWFINARRRILPFILSEEKENKKVSKKRSSSPGVKSSRRQTTEIL